MNLNAEKINIIQQIILIQDKALMNTIKSILDFGVPRQAKTTESEIDFWEELTVEQKSKIKKSILQLEAGEGLPHKDVMASFRKAYQR